SPPWHRFRSTPAGSPQAPRPLCQGAIMKRRHWLLAAMAALALGALSSCAPGTYTDVSASGRITSRGGGYDGDYDSPSVSRVYDELEPYGRWFTYGSYGWCWSPYDVPAGWRPYSEGHWLSTELGWTWVADESWGWAPFHYGRWLFDDDYGWVWVPDTVWSPAW